jgi:hypothetical protein
MEEVFSTALGVLIVVLSAIFLPFMLLELLIDRAAGIRSVSEDIEKNQNKT